MRKIILSILGVLLVVAAYFLGQYIISSNEKQRPKPKKVVKTVVVETVENGIIPIDVKAQGNLVAQRRMELFAEVQGVLQPKRKLFKPGQTYNKGETLLSIDNQEYYASVQSQKSALYNTITAIMPDLRLDYPEVFEKWQTYLNNFDINKSTPKLPEITSEKERYFISGRNIQTAYYNVKNLEQRLSKYRITAPFKGILTEALVTEGTLIRTGQKLGEYIDTGNYELEVAISKKYANLLQVGNEVTLSSTEVEKEYAGKVIRINGNVDQASQTINAYIAVSHPDLREGIFLEAILQAKEEKDAYQLSRSLLQPNDQIFVVRDSILELIPVKPVYFTDKDVVVKDIPDGTVIMSKILSGAYEGMIVKIATPETTETTAVKKRTPPVKDNEDA